MRTVPWRHDTRSGESDYGLAIITSVAFTTAVTVSPCLRRHLFGAPSGDHGLNHALADANCDVREHIAELNPFDGPLQVVPCAERHPSPFVPHHDPACPNQSTPTVTALESRRCGARQQRNVQRHDRLPTKLELKAVNTPSESVIPRRVATVYSGETLRLSHASVAQSGATGAY